MIILVADDDKLSRFTMKSMLAEIMTGEYTVLEASDGREMIEICKEKEPDIAFVDIKMPYINGIDAIVECKKCNLATAFVVVSAYSDFGAAQRAFQLDVQGYLLKPVDEEKLCQLVKKLQEKFMGEKRELNSQFQLKLFHAFNYFSTWESEIKHEGKSYREGYKYEVIGIKGRYSKQNEELYLKFQKKIIDTLGVLGKSLLESESYYSHIYSEAGTLFFMFCTTTDKKEEIYSFVKELSMQYTKQNVALHFTWFSKKNIREVYLECERLDACQGIEMNYPMGEIIHSSCINISDVGKDVLKSFYQILAAWERGDAAAYKEILYHIYHKYQNRDVELDFESVGKYFSVIMEQHTRGENFKDFCLSLIESYNSILGKAEKGTGDGVDRVKAYIDRNYMNDIGVAQIADMFGITPNYLSSVFHQKVGCKFTDYLTEIRITHAKKLLIENETASVKDISVMVGYNSTRYFTMVFKKVTGVKPAEYRKQHIVF